MSTCVVEGTRRHAVLNDLKPDTRETRKPNLLLASVRIVHRYRFKIGESVVSSDRE